MTKSNRTSDESFEPNDPFPNKLPVVVDDGDTDTIRFFPLPCAMAPYLIGALTPLLDTTRYDRTASLEDTIHTIGLIENTIAGLSSGCDGDIDLMEYIKDMYQSNCQLIGIRHDDTEFIAYDARPCINEVIDDPPPGKDGPGGGYPPPWDAPGREDGDGKRADEDYCGAAIKVREYIVGELEDIISLVELGGEVSDYIFQKIPEPASQWMSKWLFWLNKLIGAIADLGVAAARAQSQDSGYHDDIECAFYCAFKQYDSINADSIQQGVDNMPSDPLTWALRQLLTPLAQSVRDTLAGITYIGAFISRSRLFREAVLGLDEPNNDCSVNCEPCQDIGQWVARITFEGEFIRSHIEYDYLTSWEINPQFAGSQFWSGRYTESSQNASIHYFRLIFGASAVIHRVIAQYEFEEFWYPDKGTDWDYAKVGSSIKTYWYNRDVGQNRAQFDLGPFSGSYLEMRFQSSIGSSQPYAPAGIIKLQRLEIHGSGPIPPTLEPFTVEYLND